MATLRLKYVHDWHDKKTGRTRYYFRYRGQQYPLPGLPGSNEFSVAYDELRRQIVDKSSPKPIAYAPATLGGVIERYLASGEYQSKAANTRRIYRRILDRLKETAGRGLLVDLREHHVRQMREMFRPSTSQADMAVILLRVLWVFAKENLAMHLGVNPAGEVRRLHRSEAYEPWPPEVIAKFEGYVRANPVARMAFLLLLFTGQRVGDVAAMKWNQYDGEGIGVRQQKTRALLWIPCDAGLKAALDAAPRNSEFIVGKSFTSHGLSNTIKRALRRIDAEQYTTHGLRKNAAIALAEAGCTPHQIGSVTGHRTMKMLQHYTAAADQKKLAKQAIRRREVAQLRTEKAR